MKINNNYTNFFFRAIKPLPTSTTFFYGRKNELKDEFIKEKPLYTINYISNLFDFEGVTSFYLPNSNKTILARHFINDSENPPLFTKNTLVEGDFSINVDEIYQITEQLKTEINQEDDTYTQLTGKLIELNDDGGCVILSEGIKIYTTVKNSKDFKIGNYVFAQGELEFLYND